MVGFVPDQGQSLHPALPTDLLVAAAISLPQNVKVSF